MLEITKIDNLTGHGDTLIGREMPGDSVAIFLSNVLVLIP
jgi:hypothetical protein